MNLRLYITICFFNVVYLINAQNKSYEPELNKNIVLLSKSKSQQDFKQVAANFEKIVKQEKHDWLCFYYAGLSQVLTAFLSGNAEIDALCDKAELYAKKADSLSKNNSEVYVLKSMLAAARILVNKKQRAQKYGALSAKYAIEAIKLNENNPRAYLLKARNVVNTPEAFGGGKKKAIIVYEQALEKYNSFKCESNLHPNWGKQEAEKEYQILKK